MAKDFSNPQVSAEYQWSGHGPLTLNTEGTIYRIGLYHKVEDSWQTQGLKVNLKTIKSTRKTLVNCFYFLRNETMWDNWSTSNLS